MKKLQYIETDGSEIGWDLGFNLGNTDNTVYFDFMPLTGTVHYDGFYTFICSSFETIGWIVIRTHGGLYQVNGNYSTSWGNDVYFSAGTKYELVMSKTGLTQNGVVVSTTQIYPRTTENFLINSMTYENGLPRRCPNARYYGMKVMSGDTILHDVIPALDEDNNVCFYDRKTSQYIYNDGSGTPIAGPIDHIFEPNILRLNYDSTGGTNTFTVTAETGWTAESPEWGTLSPLSGASGTTNMTFQVGDYSGTERRSQTITFTDDEGYSFDLQISQKAPKGSGYSGFYIGDGNITSFYLGDYAMEAMYLGDNQIFSTGPFVGLKMTKNSTFNKEGGTNNIQITSSEDWTLSIDPNCDWLTASTLTGTTGKTVVQITAEENTQYEDLTTVITATTNSFSATCNVMLRYMKMYVKFSSENNCSLYMDNQGGNVVNLEYSYDNSNYTEWTNQSTALSFGSTDGDLYIRGMNPSGFSRELFNMSVIKAEGEDIYVDGNVMSLIDYEHVVLDIPNERCFICLFNGSQVKHFNPDFLPATGLTYECYRGMFYDSYIETSPELPAENLMDYCYYDMYTDSPISVAPVLNATNLTDGVYRVMFNRCSNLSYVKCLATDLNHYQCVYNWLNDVSSTGTFVKASGVNWPTGDSGIPNGWTVEEE